MKNRVKTIVTHGANFHADDVFAVAILILLSEKRGESRPRVIRTLAPERYPESDYIVDIGAVYNAKKGRFDHHQEGGAGQRTNGVPYSSCGLVWKAYGKELVGSSFGAQWVDRHIIQAIDGMDSGMYLYKPVLEDINPFLFQDYISMVCDNVKRSVSPDKFDKEFMRLVNLVKEVLSISIKNAQDRVLIQKQAESLYHKAQDKRVIISDKFIPTRFDDVGAQKNEKPLVFVFPDLRGGWSAKVVPKGSQTYDTYISFPKKWRGKSGEELEKITGIIGAKFCHNAGFLLVGKDKETILKLVALTFKELKQKPFIY